jgi:hypothetical protein
MNALRTRGFALAVADGKLVVRPATELTAADRESIRLHLQELLALVNDGKPFVEWDAGAAGRLMCDADALVGELGMSGLDPAVQDAAERVCRANLAENMDELRRAVTAFVLVVRVLAACAAPEGAEDRAK